MTHTIFLTPSRLSPLQAHGYATNEFEVTVERLGVYLPVRIFQLLPQMTTHSLLFRRNTSTTRRVTVTARMRISLTQDYVDL
jgi:Heterokaryon incompatibility protein Het-C